MSLQATLHRELPHADVEVDRATTADLTQRVLRFGLGLLPVPLTLAFQLALWERWVRPFGLFLFVQAIYISSWLGGLYAGLLATAGSVVIVHYYFVPPERTWALAEPRHLLVIGLFAVLGIVVSVFHERFRKATRALSASLADGQRKNEMLRRAKDEVSALYNKTKELDELKTHLFTSVSHELRTPLSLVLGPGERLVATTDENSDVHRDAEIIVRNARTLLHYVDDLLQVTKLEARTVEPEYTALDLSRIVRFTASQFEGAARMKKMSYEVQTPETLKGEFDDALLQRVLLNLLSNAFKFTPEGGRVRLTLRADEVTDRVVIEVADSGPGIPLEKRDAVFNAYLQLEGRSARRFAGTGLGLSIARELVQLQDGRIFVTDAPEGGALFVAELPRTARRGTTVKTSAWSPRISDALQAETRTLVEEIGRARHGVKDANGPKGKPLVLVVEDNRDMNDAICAALRDDYRVAAAFDGKAGLQMAFELKPDLVLTDVMMPELNGEELVRALHADGQLGSLPVIVLTAVADEHARVRLLRDGARDYVIKPFRTEELLARVSNAVAQRSAERAVLDLSARLESVGRAAGSVSEAIATLPKQSVEAVLRMIASQAQILTGAEYVAVGLGTDPEKPFDPWVFLGVSPEEAAAMGNLHPRPQGVLGFVASRGIPLRLRDVREHPAYVHFPAAHPQMTSFLGVPLRYRDRAVGHLYLANKRDDDEFSEADQTVVELLAARAGAAIEMAHLYETEGTMRAWLEAVVEQLPEAVLLLDAEGHIATVNRAAAAIRAPHDGRRDPFGNPLPLELRLPNGELLPPEEIPYVRTIRRGQPEPGRELLIQAGDRALPVWASAVPIHGPDGQTVGATALFRDLSEQKEVERMRDEWSAVVAHDLRQPVGVITLAAELVRRAHGDAISNGESKHFDRIQLATRRLKEMIDELLDVTQLDSRRLVLSRAEVDVAKAAREVCERMGVAAQGHPTTVREVDRPKRVWADPARLDQVLSNLVSNACKYGEPDTELRIDIEGHENDVLVSVTNRGRGIPSDEVPKLFHRFMRSTTSRKTGVSGIGLGLYICKGLVEAHGGRIWVESTPNETTTFHFTLPVRSCE